MPPRKPTAGGKLKRPLTEKLRAAAEQRLGHLRTHLRLQPLAPPPRALAPEGSPEEAVLRALGLLDFARLGLGLSSEPLRPDLVAPLVAYYDPAQRRSFVRGVRVGVSRKHFADALRLPCKPASTAQQPDADPAAVVAAALELMQAYVLPPFQGDDMCILPQEVAAAEQAVREGSAHRVDWAGLIWGLVEKEMQDLPKRDDGLCYYGAYLQRLIWAHKPELFERTEEERGELVLEVSDMDDEDGDDDTDVKSKSMQELESGDADANADARSNSLDKLEAGGADLRSNSLEELVLGDADVRGKNTEELELEVEDKLSKGLGEMGAADVDANHMDVDEPEAVDEDTKGKSFGESEMGFVSVEAVSVTHEVMLPNDEDVAEVAAEGDGDTAMAAVEKDAGSLEETIVMTHEEFVAVPEEDEEEAYEDEVKDATGLSLGIRSANDYDSTDVEEDANVENLGEGDSSNEEAEGSEEDAFGQYRSEEMNWTMGDEKGHGSDFVNLQFENLNKGDVEIRNEVSYDDGFSGKMGSLHGMTSTNLLQAMSSIPATYNVSENAPDLSSGEFLAMGADAHKNGLDLGTGSPYFFQNNGKRHIGEIEEYNDHMSGHEQFDQRNQHKRTRNSNNSSISPGSAVFNAHFAEPFQNLMSKASMFYEQKERELQEVLVEKQYLANLLQEKEQIIQSLNSARFEQENKWQAELRRFEHDLNVMAQLVTGYRRALKQNRASFDEYRKKFPCNKPRYCDVAGGGGLVLSVKELDRKRLEEEQQKLAVANEMIDNFQHEWFSKVDDWAHSIHFLWTRTEELIGELNLLREKRKAKVTTPAIEEPKFTTPATGEAKVTTPATEETKVTTPATEEA
ncbi:hypothetical protein E2562_019852 [Oryza meyeriana var. granulata]|uniref:Uncharacterized protein n=1 Tax=Oryza meyeriana var. granulata TaxID=110450 RepID=A0A6G1CTJ7_9ORYZ|nr:hypothetical protein E2562_019852 [Oryza meyeriana var. granulata]